MKLVDIKRNTYINSSKEINDKYLKFNIGDIARISKYKNYFRIVRNWSYEDFVIEKFKNTVLWRYAISDINREEIAGRSYKKQF